MLRGAGDSRPLEYFEIIGLIFLHSHFQFFVVIFMLILLFYVRFRFFFEHIGGRVSIVFFMCFEELL